MDATLGGPGDRRCRRGNLRRAWTGHTDGVVEGLVVCVEAGQHAGLGDGADDMSAYLVEVLVLTGNFCEALEQAAALLPRLAARADEVVVLTTGRLAPPSPSTSSVLRRLSRSRETC